jgi:hypothetical protein
VLTGTTTLFALLEAYPFLEDFLIARHPAFGRLAGPGRGRGWARLATLGELATAMNLPRLELLRELRAEVQRQTGVAPGIAEVSTGAADPRLQDALREALRDLERGAALDELAARLDRETQGLDAAQVAALARGAGLRVAGAESMTPSAALQPADVPANRLALGPRHPVRALLEEGARVRELTSHVDELLTGLQGTRGAERWSRARPALAGLLKRLVEVERQARRLRLAWYATVSSRGGHAVIALVDEDLVAAVDGLRHALAVVEKGDREAAVTASRSAASLVLRALAAQEELLVPVALSSLADDDWEIVAEQERVVGWALARDQAL